jgi:sterol 3beta-glucosyltransferase
MRKQGVPQLYMVSPTLFPKPSDWSSNDHETGYWYLDEPGWQPSKALLDFLEAGPKPLFFGFGSMAIKEPQRVTTTILKALSITGQRAIIAKGWGGIGEGVELPDNVFLVGETSHEWLFERVGAIVHHGGCGTTHSSLRAGLPTLIIPFTSDQPMWGHAVHQKGIGPKPIPIKKLTPENLAQALMAMTDTGMIERAKVNGEKVRAEGGVEKAAAVIEETLTNIPEKILATA